MDLLALAEEKISADEDESAVALLSQALNEEPNGYKFYRRGYVYFRMESYDKAIEDLTKAIDSSDLSGQYRGQALASRGLCHAAQGNLLLSLSDARQIVDYAQVEPEQLDEACDVVDTVIKSMKQTVPTVTERAALEQLLQHLSQDVFKSTDYGCTWATKHLSWLRTSA